MSKHRSNRRGAKHTVRGATLLATLALAGAPLVACGSSGGAGASDAPQHDDHDHGDNGNDGNDEPDPISVEMLTPRAEFTDDVAAQIRLKFDGHGTNVMNLRDSSRIAIAEITIQPGAVFPWHTHPGPVFITIAQGDFVYRLASDCVDRGYAAGEALVDAGGTNIHTAYNPSDEDETVVIATFLGAPDEGPLTVPVDGPDPDDCPLPTP